MFNCRYFYVTLAFTTLLHSMALHAQLSPDVYRLFPVTECPAIGDEYAAALNKLAKLKAAVKTEAKCSHVVDKVKSLDELIVGDHSKLSEITEAGKTQALTKEQSEFVRRYAEDVTTKVTTLYDLIGGSNECFPEDQRDQQLTNLSNFVGEVSQLVAVLAGPWGTPIALTGHIVAGFLTGMEKIVKSRTGYDFADPDQWANYVTSLCTFERYKEQIQYLLDPLGRLAELNTFKRRLELQEKAVMQTCPDCIDVEKQFIQHNAPASSAMRKSLSSYIERIDKKFLNPYASYTLKIVAVRLWIDEEIKRVQNDQSTYWANVSGRRLLKNAKLSLEQFLIEKEAPRFLLFQSHESEYAFTKFLDYVKSEGQQLVAMFNAIAKNRNSGLVNYWYSPLDIFKQFVTKPIAWELIPDNGQKNELFFAWTHFREHSIDNLKTAESSLAVIQGFCSFFKQSGQYSRPIRKNCTSYTLQNLAKTEAELIQSLPGQNVSALSLLSPKTFEDSNSLGLVLPPMSRFEALRLQLESIPLNAEH